MSAVRQPFGRLASTAHASFRRRYISTTLCLRKDDESPTKPSSKSSQPTSRKYAALMSAPTQALLDIFDEVAAKTQQSPKSPYREQQKSSTSESDVFKPASISEMPLQPAGNIQQQEMAPPPNPNPGKRPGYIHVHSTSITRNIFVAITDHKHNPIVAMSAGRLGLKHTRRSSQEAAYDTTVAAFNKLAQTDHEIREVELVLKGFGNGRKGFLSAVLGQHGDFLRNKIVRVTDSTPLKIGGTKVRNKPRK